MVTDNSNKLYAVKLNGAGDFAWADSLKIVGKTINSKSRYGFTDVYNGQAVAVWQDDKGNGDMPYAQNIRCDESTGAESLQNIAANTLQLPAASLGIKNVYPNPAQNILTATIISSKTGKSYIYITDMSGNVLKQFQKNIQKGNNSIQLNVSNLKAGSYFIKVMNENGGLSILFNKQ